MRCEAVDHKVRLWLGPQKRLRKFALTSKSKQNNYNTGWKRQPKKCILPGLPSFYLKVWLFNAMIRDVGHSKLLSWGVRCDHRKTSIVIYQKKVFSELYRALPLSSRTFNVCVSCAHFHFFQYKFQLNENAKALCLYCTDSKDTNIFVKVIQWDKLWYDFPVFTVKGSSKFT